MEPCVQSPPEAVVRASQSKYSNSLVIHFQAICIEDPYAREKNVTHTEYEIKEIVADLKDGTQEVARALGRVINACYHQSHSLYSDMHPSITYENYGPYDVSKQYGTGAILVMKQFANLKAPDLWPDTTDVPYNRVDIVSVYNKNVTMRVDAVSHSTYTGNLTENLLAYDVSVDGDAVAVRDLQVVSGHIEESAATIFKQFKALSFEEQKEKYWHQKAYSYKGLYERLGRDWRPTEDVIEEGRNKKLYEPKYPKDKDELINVLKKMIDPRVDCKKESCLV